MQINGTKRPILVLKMVFCQDSFLSHLSLLLPNFALKCIAIHRYILKCIKEIYSDSNNIILLHELEDINKQSLFPKFQLIWILRFQVMHDYVCFIVPKDYCVE